MSVIMRPVRIIPSCPTILNDTLGCDGYLGFKVSVIMGPISGLSQVVLPSYAVHQDGMDTWDIKCQTCRDYPKLSNHPTRYIRIGWTLGI